LAVVMGYIGIVVVCCVGLSMCDQSVYPVETVGAGHPSQYVGGGVQGDGGGYYSQAPYGQDVYDYAQYSDTDRTLELIEGALTIPMAIIAFFSALLGGILAPIISDGVRALAEFELPRIELPEEESKGRTYSGDLVKPVSTGYKLTAENIIRSALRD